MTFFCFSKEYSNLLSMILLSRYSLSASISSFTSIETSTVVTFPLPNTICTFNIFHPRPFPSSNSVRHPAYKKLPPSRNFPGNADVSIKIEYFDPDYPESVERVEPEEENEDDDNGATRVTIVDNVSIGKVVEVPLLLTMVPFSVDEVYSQSKYWQMLSTVPYLAMTYL